MRILVISMDRGIRPGGTKGAAVHLSSVCGAWVRAGHDVALVTPTRAVGDIEPGIDLVTVEPCDVVARVKELGDFDIVHERYSLGSRSGLDAAAALGIPLTLEVNAPLVREATLHRPETVRSFDRDVEELMFRAADTIVAVSRPLARMIEEVRGRRDVNVVPNGCDPALFERRVSQFDRTMGLAFLGHPKPWHGADDLPVTLRALRDRGLEIPLEIIGGGPGAESVLATARVHEVDDLVTVTGSLPHAAACERLSRIAVAVAPYPPMESFYFCPIKVIEGMAAGCAVVASDIGDISEITAGAAVLTPAGDHEALADEIEGLMNDAARRDALGSAARRRAHETLSWGAVARETLAASAGARNEGVA